MEDVREIVARLMDIESEDVVTAAMEELAAFKKYLSNKYPDAQGYVAYHALQGSGPNNSIVEIVGEDFPGEDSVRDFVFSLKEKYLNN